MFILLKIADFWGYKHLSATLVAYQKNCVAVDFLFFSFYGKIVVDRIDCLEQETKKRRNNLQCSFFNFQFFYFEKNGIIVIRKLIDVEFERLRGKKKIKKKVFGSKLNKGEKT